VAVARKQARLAHPAALLGLWDVVDSTIVTTQGIYLQGLELQGLDSEHMPGATLVSSANALYRDFVELLPEQTFLQVVLDSHGDYFDLFKAFEAAPQPDHPVLALQRQRRIEHLERSNLRRHSVYLFTGLLRGFGAQEFRSLSEATHLARLRELEELSSKVHSMLEAAGLKSRTMDREALQGFYFKALNPGQPVQPAFRPGPELACEETLRRDSRLRVRTLREHLMQSDLEWSPDWLRVGDQFVQTLSLQSLPQETQFADPELFYHLDFDFRLSVSVRIPDQRRFHASLNQQRRFAKADAGRGGNIEDFKRTERVREGEELAELLAESGQRLVLLSAQAALSAPTATELTRRVRAFQDKARTKQYAFFSERYAHDREFFKTLPGMAATSERLLLVTSNNAVDCLPLFQERHGDRDPVMLVRTDRGELYSFNPFERSRDNWNATIFGASGSGKSVFCNLLIATSILSNSTKGRLIVVDFAGATKSSYLMLARMFGGKFIPVLASDYALNPFPPPEKALDDRGEVLGEVETFLTVLTDILLSNTGQTKEEQLYRHIIQRGIRDTYRRIQDRAPIYTDLFDTLKDYSVRAGDIDREKLSVVLRLLGGFLSSGSARLFNRQSTATPDSPFLILDLYGIDSLDARIAQAVVFLTTQWVKSLAFDASDPGYKYVLLDEVAQLIKRQEMVGLLDELYSTARKHRTSVWTVTQSYHTYRQSALASTVKLNSTTQIFLSHASDEAGRKLIAEDYQFQRREKHLFDGLRTIKGKYSSALIRTEVADQRTREKSYITSVLHIDLSPLDYEICTSDAEDRELQRRYFLANPGRPEHEVLEHIAYRVKAEQGREGQ